MKNFCSLVSNNFNFPKPSMQIELVDCCCHDSCRDSATTPLATNVNVNMTVTASLTAPGLEPRSSPGHQGGRNVSSKSEIFSINNLVFLNNMTKKLDQAEICPMLTTWRAPRTDPIPAQKLYFNGILTTKRYSFLLFYFTLLCKHY